MTQVSQIRRHLTDGKTITPMQAIAVYGIFRLASVIEDLRLEGMQIDCVLKYDEVGKKYGEYRLRQPIKVGSQVQVKPGYGIPLPNWVRKLRTAKVIDKKADTSLVLFVRGKNMESHWLNDKELVSAS